MPAGSRIPMFQGFSSFLRIEISCKNDLSVFETKVNRLPQNVDILSPINAASYS